MDWLLLPLAGLGYVFIPAPFAALLPAVLFFWLFAKSKRVLTLIAGLLWLVYLGYEYLMKLRIFCSGECNIRVDLLLIYPLLLLVSLIALIAGIRALRNN